MEPRLNDARIKSVEATSIACTRIDNSKHRPTLVDYIKTFTAKLSIRIVFKQLRIKSLQIRWRPVPAQGCKNTGRTSYKATKPGFSFQCLFLCQRYRPSQVYGCMSGFVSLRFISGWDAEVGLRRSVVRAVLLRSVRPFDRPVQHLVSEINSTVLSASTSSQSIRLWLAFSCSYHIFSLCQVSTHHSHHPSPPLSFTAVSKPTSFTNLSHHRLSSGFRTDSMDFLAGEFLQFFMVALQNRADHYIFILWFLSSSSASSIFFYGRPM